MTTSSTRIEYFKKQAKNLFRQVEANNPSASERVRVVLKDQTDISLMRVQHVIAIEYGFSKWENLIKASADELQMLIDKKNDSLSSEKADEERIKRSWSDWQGNKPKGTPLGNFLRGPGIIPTPPHRAALADIFDKMTMDEQRRYLDEDARRMGMFNRD